MAKPLNANQEKALELHKLWREYYNKGSRFNISDYGLDFFTGVDLSSADLKDAMLVDADLSGADLSYADLREATLRDANLTKASLWGSDLRGTNLKGVDLTGTWIRWTVGNGKEIKTLQTDTYTVVYTATTMAIGCQQHFIADWWELDDEKINRMDKNALELWKKWKPILESIGVFDNVKKGNEND